MPDDDELTIDFGKLFRKKKKEDEPQTKQAETKEPSEQRSQSSDSEITIDFSKIKDWFKKQKTTKAESKEELAVDFSKIKAFANKHPVLVVLAIVLVLQFVPNKFSIGGADVYAPWGGMYMRLQAQNLPNADVWASNVVTNSLKSQIRNAINQQYPNLPDDRKNKLIDEQLTKLLQEQRQAVDQQVSAIADQFRARFQYEVNGKKFLYMPDIDPYQWLRYAQNLVQKGRVGDEVRNGIQWDNHMVAPVGAEVPREMHPYTLAFVYKFLKVFSPSIPLMHAATFFPVILVLLSLIPAFFVGRKLGGMMGGVAAATMVAVSTAIFTRTMWGHADTDAYNVFFPILCTWLFFESLDAEGWKKTSVWSGLLGLAFGLYAWAWPAGWWYVFDFLLITLAAVVGFEAFKNFQQPKRLIELVKPKIITGASILVSTGVFVALFRSFRDFWLAPIQPIYFRVIKIAAHKTLWPNVYTTVAELNPTNILGAVGSVGGKLIFGIALLGIVLMLLKRTDNKWRFDLKHGVYFGVWFAATLYATTKGVRFTLLLAPAVALCFGIALGKIYSWLPKWLNAQFQINKKIIAVALILLFAWLYMTPVRGSDDQARQDVPIMNDGWWNALTKIKQESTPDAIINSWWDFGHHFKYVADRRVTFDGASQNTPMAHWIGKVLLTDNETQAVGILRMLDCGSNKAFEAINNQTNNTVRSVNLLYDLIVADKPGARTILEQNNIQNPELVLGLTHCEPPENYFITSHDMIGKSGVWGHFGSWNFEKAMLWTALREQPKEQAVDYMVKNWNYTEQRAEQAYFDVQSITNEDQANNWIAPWPGIIGNSRSDCEEKNNVIRCGNGILINKTNKQTVVRLRQGTGIPHSLVFLGRDGEFKEFKQNNSNIGLSAIVWYAGSKKYSSLLASPELAKSLFVRLYFMEGHGLKHFKLFDRQDLVTGGQVIVWKIDWAGGKPNKLSSFKPVTGKAGEGHLVTVNYIGLLENGSVFDSSIVGWQDLNISEKTNFSEHETKPLQFVLGEGEVVAGFDAAVRGMKPGDEKIVQIPPNAAYGTDPAVHPLGNQTLRFKIQLVKIE